jgi:hypothetical protein
MKTMTDTNAAQRQAEARQRLADARSAENERESTHKSARGRLRALQVQLEAGQEVDPLEWATASASVDISKTLLATAESKRTEAERKARHNDLDVAQAIADALGDLYTCDATITDRLPDAVDKRKLPQLYIVQPQATNHLGQGVIGGSARLVLAVTDRMTTGPTAPQISAPLDRRGFKAGLVVKSPTETVGGVWLNETLVTLTEGWANYPKLVERYDKPAGRQFSLAVGDMINHAVFTYAPNRGVDPAPRITVGWAIGSTGPVTEGKDGRCEREITLGIALEPAYQLPEQWAAAGLSLIHI